MTYAYDLIETLNGDRINLGDYLTRKDFYTYYHSFLTEREYIDRIKSYYKKLEINELLDEIKRNWLSNSNFEIYKEETRETLNGHNNRITSNTNRLNTLENVTIPTLMTKEAYNNNIRNYTTLNRLTETLALYPTLEKYNRDLNLIKNSSISTNDANTLRFVAIENRLEEIYDKTWVNNKFNLYYTKEEVDDFHNVMDSRVDENERQITINRNNL